MSFYSHGGGSLYDVISCLAAWSNVPSGGFLSLVKCSLLGESLSGGLCRGGLCPRGSLSKGSLPGGVCVQGGSLSERVSLTR